VLRPESERKERRVSDFDERSGIRARGEEALSDLAQAMLENPLFNQALGKALGAGERAVQAQRSAMGALNVASSDDLERVERRLRSLSDRLEAIEDRLDDLTDDVSSLRGSRGGVSPAQSGLAVSDTDSG